MPFPHRLVTDVSRGPSRNGELYRDACAMSQFRLRYGRTLGPDDEPILVCLYVQPIGDRWAAMIVADGVLPPAPGELKGLTFFGDTAEEAERLAHAYLMVEAVN
jgi:hypothetical protein